MIESTTLYIPILIAGAFMAAFVIGAVGFADALILNSVWLHIMEPSAAIPLVVCCGFAMHLVPLYKLRHTLDFSHLLPFAIPGVVGVPLGVWVLGYLEPDLFRAIIGVMLIIYGLWMLLKPHTIIKAGRNHRLVDGLVGLGGGFMGGFAGLSGLFPTLWAGLRGWPKNTQRGVYQPFVVIMHALGIMVFAGAGMMTTQTGVDLLWCLPVIVLGSWLGVKIYPFLDEKLFRRIILALVLISGVTILV